MSMLPPDPLYIYKGSMDSVMCLMMKRTNDAPHIYAGTVSGIVHIWDLKTNREAANFKSSQTSCLSLHSFVNDEVITQDKLGHVRFWKEDGLHWVLIKDLNMDIYGFCKCVPHDDLLYIPCDTSFLKAVCGVSKKVLSTYSVKHCSLEKNSIMSFKLMKVNNMLLALIAYENSDIMLWNLEEQNTLTPLSTITGDECPMALACDEVNMVGICGFPTNKMLVFDINKKNFEIKLRRHIVLKNVGVASLAIRPDGKLLAVGCWDGKLRLYSMKSFNLLAALDAHSGTIQDVVFSLPESDCGKKKYYLAAASKDCKLSLWDLYNQ